MKDICELCSLCSPNMGCTKLENESCLKEAIKLIKPSVTDGEVIQKMFPDAKVTEESYVVFMNIEECNHLFDKAWWDRKWGE